MTQNNTQHIDWKNLTWKEKMGICQKGISHEDSILLTYVTLFVAIEALFFACILSANLIWWFNIIISLVAIVLTVRFVMTFYRRGYHVDLWGSLISELWNEVDTDNETIKKISQRYKVCTERINSNWKTVILNWGKPKEVIKAICGGYARPLLFVIIPFIIILSWIIVIVISLMYI
jgi:hypothetical protein